MSDSVRPASARREPELASWDEHADVVVVGFGVAGAAAAVAAAVSGADVLVVERTSGWGGAASQAGGFIYLGGGTAIQRACGFTDTPENMHAFLAAAMGTGADQRKLALYAERSVEHFDWLVDCGVPFRKTFYGKPGWEPPGDEGLMYSGGENAHPFDGLVPPAPRGHVPQMTGKRTGERGGGYMLMKPLVETALTAGVRAVYDTRFERLVTANDGRVRGVVATHYGREIAIHAQRSVVLAAGSFAFNPAMVDRHVPALSGRPGAAVEEHDGQAVRAAQALGADVEHLHACEAAVHTDPGLMVRGIVVDARGDRVINEDTYPGRIGEELLARRGSQGFLLVDEQAAEEAEAARDAAALLAPQPSWVSEDIGELEAEAGIPAGALAATLEVYNRHAENGQDPVHRKATRWVRPLRPPYGLYGVRGRTGGFPLGGLRTDVDGGVLDVDGQPIPGLRAAGRTTAGLAAGGYASGISLGDGSFFGRRAGRAAAQT
ncbi:FAD-dependent oxidoreductase [Saccharopolyspora flava]|uniref:3-oxo-5alpha-steroid 4-dehydrogenase n=1 Tax=Saccharopolyspora flava TaxID=95161 RepID=A0A1I6UF19_9PSEU|nr:FAD-dependent oxidoreductase [Saccharopolyspora flava]SFT00022.1 3-oxo-5alpha-steroid 4-dehydrogenase [Saccharopolyspora flava]